MTTDRLRLVLAAVLWSLGSLFVRVLREPLALGLNEPPLTALQLAFFRGLFGGLVPRREVAFRPTMGLLVVVLAGMSGLYLSALALGPAANAVFLQNTAPLWVYVFAVLVLRERGDVRGWQTVLIGAAGTVVIVAGSWLRAGVRAEHREQVTVLLMGLSSGALYAIVVLLLRALCDYSATWLVSLNLLGTAATLGLFVFLRDGWSPFATWATAPSAAQVAVLVLFGSVQMALPYWLFTRGLRTVPPHEATLIALIEPPLNSIWAYLVAPETDTPNLWMFSGCGLILFALVWKYVPVRRATRGG